MCCVLGSPAWYEEVCVVIDCVLISDLFGCVLYESYELDSSFVNTGMGNSFPRSVSVPL